MKNNLTKCLGISNRIQNIRIVHRPYMNKNVHEFMKTTHCLYRNVIVKIMDSGYQSNQNKTCNDMQI